MIDFSVIPGYPTYFANTLGEIWSKPRLVRFVSKRGRESWRLTTSRRLRPNFVGKGYFQVSLGVGHRRYVHRLVALAFHGIPAPGYEVNHKNGVKTDNRPENLEWVTKSQNARHSTHVLGKKRGQFGPNRVRVV